MCESTNESFLDQSFQPEEIHVPGVTKQRRAASACGVGVGVGVRRRRHIYIYIYYFLFCLSLAILMSRACLPCIIEDACDCCVLIATITSLNIARVWRIPDVSDWWCYIVIQCKKVSNKKAKILMTLLCKICIQQSRHPPLHLFRHQLYHMPWYVDSHP